MSDAEEFRQEAESAKDSSSEEVAKKWEAPRFDSTVSEEKESSSIGKLIQYQYNGPGYTPTTKTTAKIPPGVYGIENVNRMLTFVPRTIHSDKLMRLPDSKSDMVINRIQRFWELKNEFKHGNSRAEGGFLHKIGIMLFGPPGSGKTTTVKFLIKDVVERGGVAFLADSNPELIRQGLVSFREIEPEKPAVVVFEDFDELIRKYSESEYLAILDGDSSIDNVVFIASTNYPSRFDPRMYNRPGRFSDVIKIGMPTPEARRLYLLTKIKNAEEVEIIVAKTDGFSIDHLKALVLGVYFEGRELESEIKRLTTLFKAPKDDNGNDSSNRMGIM